MKIEEKLRDHGLKVTPQRLAIYRMLSGTKAHPSVEMIHRELLPEHPAMSLATVYKTLETFKRNGLVQELNVGEDSYRYDADTNPHIHLVCRKCGRVDDYFDERLIRSVTDSIRGNCEYELADPKFFFQGLCPECRKKN